LLPLGREAALPLKKRGLLRSPAGASSLATVFLCFQRLEKNINTEGSSGTAKAPAIFIKIPLTPTSRRLRRRCCA